jgi:hypothetical protein
MMPNRCRLRRIANPPQQSPQHRRRPRRQKGTGLQKCHCCHLHFLAPKETQRRRYRHQLRHHLTRHQNRQNRRQQRYRLQFHTRRQRM